MDDNHWMRSLKAAFPEGNSDAGHDWAELADRSKRVAERKTVLRGHRRMAVAAAGVAGIVGLAACWMIGVTSNWSRHRDDQVADQKSISAEQQAIQATLAELQRQASVQQALIRLTSAQARTARLQQELATFSDDDSTFDSMLAEARAASWLLADAERRAKRDESHEQLEARRLYEQLVRVYPGTPAAERASARLAQHSPGAR